MSTLQGASVLLVGNRARQTEPHGENMRHSLGRSATEHATCGRLTGDTHGGGVEQMLFC